MSKLCELNKMKVAS